MRVTNIHVARGGSHCELRADVRGDRFHRAFRLWYRFPDELEPFLQPRGDVFAAACFVPAMRLGESLTIDEDVSPRLLRSIDELQSIFRCWDRDLSHVEIDAGSSVRAELPRDQQTGLFFSAGVDSFYSLMRGLNGGNHDARGIDQLVLVRGFDIPLLSSSDRAFAVAEANARRVAEELGLRSLAVSTNVRDLLDRYARWGALGHGAALASVGLALEGLFSEMRIAASYTYNQLHPWGSHPLTDPLWSTESLAFIHDGADADRLGKVRFIARSPIVLETLRVCWERTDLYNCGECEKCLRTMIGLHIAGALDRTTIFPTRTLDLDAIGRLSVPGESGRMFLRQLVDALDAAADAPLRAALERCLAGPADDGAAHHGSPDVDLDWFDRVDQLNNDLERLVRPGSTIVLADQEELRHAVSPALHALPFLERNGGYWGAPADDATAIAELERLRNDGAELFALTWPTFWWQQQYPEFMAYLRRRFGCVIENDRLIAFELKSSRRND